MTAYKNIIEIKNLSVTLADKIILQNVNLTVHPGEILAIAGGSGAGKTTLLRAMLMLNKATGSIKICGKEILNGTRADYEEIRQLWGVMFQQGALFSSLTVLDNVAYPLQEYTQLMKPAIEEIAKLKIALVGLDPEVYYRYPAELSGGMKKRAALARAIALDPQLLFLDEPTAGLDPHGASALDELILNLHQNLRLTVIMVTHDLDTLWRTTDRVAFLGNKKILEVAHMAELTQSKQPLIKAYFSDERSRVARVLHEAE